MEVLPNHRLAWMAREPGQPALQVVVARQTPPSAVRGRQGHARQRCAPQNSRQMSAARPQGIRDIEGAQAGLREDGPATRSAAPDAVEHEPCHHPRVADGTVPVLQHRNGATCAGLPCGPPPAPGSQCNERRYVRGNPRPRSLSALQHWPRQDGAMAPVRPRPDSETAVGPSAWGQPENTNPR